MFGDQVAGRLLCGPCLAVTEADGPLGRRGSPGGRVTDFRIEDRGEAGHNRAGRWQVRHLPTRLLVIAPDHDHPAGRAVAFATRERAEQVAAWAAEHWRPDEAAGRREDS